VCARENWSDEFEVLSEVEVVSSTCSRREVVWRGRKRRRKARDRWTGWWVLIWWIVLVLYMRLKTF
jgi:predicted nucleic acid-binding Zn ribbon protein